MYNIIVYSYDALFTVNRFKCLRGATFRGKIMTFIVKKRKQAILDGENTYFTGKPCVNGHISYRYVQSGTCYECINGSRINHNSDTAMKRQKRLKEAAAAIRTKQEATAAAVRDRETLQSRFVYPNVECHPEDVAVLKAAVVAFAMMRVPTATEADVWRSKAPTHGVLYKVRCHADDVPAVRALAQGMYAARTRAQLEQKAQELLRKVEGEGWQDTTPPINFK